MEITVCIMVLPQHGADTVLPQHGADTRAICVQKQAQMTHCHLSTSRHEWLTVAEVGRELVSFYFFLTSSGKRISAKEATTSSNKNHAFSFSDVMRTRFFSPKKRALSYVCEQCYVLV